MANELERAGRIHVLIRIIEVGGGRLGGARVVLEQELKQLDRFRPESSMRFEDEGAELRSILHSRSSKFLDFALFFNI